MTSVCTDGCIGTGQAPVGTDAPVEYAAMIACQAAQLTATNYTCSPQSDSSEVPGPKVNTACDTQICAWTCTDQAFSFIDENMHTHCGC